jgi:hypothetical protein
MNNTPEALSRQLDDYATEIGRLRNVIQAACLGGTDLMIERWKQLFPDAPVPSVKPVAPVALREVGLTRDTTGMCVVTVNGREAIRDNGDVISHYATPDWFSDAA